MFGDYEVIVAVGAGDYAPASNCTSWGSFYRNRCTDQEDDAVISWSVSGLNPSAVVKEFELNLTRVAPCVGSDNGSYYLSLSGPGATGIVSQERSSMDILADFVPVNPPLLVADESFGYEPVFELVIDEREPLTTRTIGVSGFTITAGWNTGVVPGNPVPEDGQSEVPLEVTFSWSDAPEPPDGLTGYYFYLAEDIPDFSGSTPLLFINNTNPVKSGPLNLESDKTYYWRVDQSIHHSDAASPDTRVGPVWYFTTKESVPKIKTSPAGAIVNPGESVTLVIDFVSMYSPQVNWYRTDGMDPVALEDNSHTELRVVDLGQDRYRTTLTIQPVAGSDSGYYYGRVTSMSGAAESDRALIQAPDLVAYYPLDGSLADLAGGNNAVISAGVPVYVDSQGDLGQALKLDDTEPQYLSLGRNGQPSGLTLLNGSASFWFMIDNPQDSRPTLMGILNEGGYQRLQFSINSGRPFVSNKDAEGSAFSIYPDSVTVSSGQWHHFLATWEFKGLYRFKLYFDARFVGEITQADWQIEPWQYDLVVGATNNAGEILNNWDGLLDEIKIYNYPLTVEEIALEWQQGTGEVLCLHPPLYDLDNDCKIDMTDLILLAGEWICNGNWPQ